MKTFFAHTSNRADVMYTKEFLKAKKKVLSMTFILFQEI
jgi:hypothetical protein